jgi:hypothetical protein
MPSDPHVVKEAEGGDQRHGRSDRAGDRCPCRSGPHRAGGAPGATGRSAGNGSDDCAGDPGDVRGSVARRLAPSRK